MMMMMIMMMIRGRDGGTNFILRIKQQETRLTLQEHDDDEKSVPPMEYPFTFLTGKEYLEQPSDSFSPRMSISVAEESSGEENCRSVSFKNCTSHLMSFRHQTYVAVMSEACSMRSEGKRHV